MFPAFLDACVIYPFYVVDILLRLAEDGTYRPLWSADVIEESSRALIRDGADPDSIRRRAQNMRETFPDAEVVGYESLIPCMPNDEKDRHVLAAAVRGDAAIIVTYNLRDFPDDQLAPFHIEAKHPDDFLLDQLDLHPDSTLRCLCEQSEDSKLGHLTLVDLAHRLQVAQVPKFAEAVLGRIG